MNNANNSIKRQTNVCPSITDHKLDCTADILQ